MYTEGIKESGLKPFAIGIVAEDIEENSTIIKVYPQEILTNTVDIDISTIKTTTTNSTSSSGNEESIVVDKSSVIIAKWLPKGNDNRITAPMVCKGETVQLYNFAGTDEYYWTTLDNEMDLRKNEKATYFFSNKKIIDTSGNLINKGYHFTVDCINKFIRLFTSNNDEEFTTYDLKINTKEGVLTITDGKSNFIKLFSQEDKLVITTNKRVEVNTVECEVNATETATVNTKLCTINATDKAEVNTKVSIINAEDSAEVNTKNSTVNASDVSNINTKEANIKAENQCNVEATMANIKAKNECNIETAMAKIKANANCSIESAQISLKGNISVN